MEADRDVFVSVHVSSEWGADPLWVVTTTNSVRTPCPIDAFRTRYGISAGLADELAGWDQAFRDTYRPNDPLESGFDTEAEAVAWDETGRRLAIRLAGELPDSVRVIYRSDTDEVVRA
ncbi:hypothetical protein UA74_11225 [Actinoalloteichus fjordicus]|uniref:Uncharacterized protein n=1 Tax=Actinoalloteichus fjordicus TaxID=1612552 RepID=A0AAC9LDD7_9PSEU|nr:hypothetical protein UA74_11225 [Actinoalloteichus fjordicus]